MINEKDLTEKFMGTFVFEHFYDEHAKDFKPNSRELFNFLYPLEDMLDKDEYDRFQSLLDYEINEYAYASYQNGFKDGVRHLIGMLRL